ncbi:uncharacterized protein LOC107857762 [Capsicum annuum]|uniref:uncharacterized protein LOC107857762 n=1 Tax=Capsicum annuum TaxID=4072 RepID=UPI001FB056D4|nr:uncharacterized protein LOC107857762 [Capsicum annuum]
MDGYQLWYSCSERHRNRVVILVDKELRGQVVEVKRVSDRPMMIKLVIGEFTLHVCRVHEPKVGLGEEVKVTFWKALDEMVRSVPSLEKIIIAGDFNGHIGVFLGGYGDVRGGFSFGNRNGEEVALLDFMRAFGLVVVNLNFLKKEDRLITFRSASAKIQINFLLLSKRDRAMCKDCKFILSEHILTQHRLLVMDLIIKKNKKSRAGEGQPKIKWGGLTPVSVLEIGEKVSEIGV